MNTINSINQVSFQRKIHKTNKDIAHPIKPQEDDSFIMETKKPKKKHRFAKTFLAGIGIIIGALFAKNKIANTKKPTQANEIKQESGQRIKKEAVNNSEKELYTQIEEIKQSAEPIIEDSKKIKERKEEIIDNSQILYSQGRQTIETAKTIIGKFNKTRKNSIKLENGGRADILREKCSVVAAIEIRDSENRMKQTIEFDARNSSIISINTFVDDETTETIELPGAEVSITTSKKVNKSNKTLADTYTYNELGTLKTYSKDKMCSDENATIAEKYSFELDNITSYAENKIGNGIDTHTDSLYEYDKNGNLSSYTKNLDESWLNKKSYESKINFIDSMISEYIEGYSQDENPKQLQTKEYVSFDSNGSASKCFKNITSSDGKTYKVATNYELSKGKIVSEANDVEFQTDSEGREWNLFQPKFTVE